MSPLGDAFLGRFVPRHLLGVCFEASPYQNLIEHAHHECAGTHCLSQWLLRGLLWIVVSQYAMFVTYSVFDLAISIVLTLFVVL